MSNLTKSEFETLKSEIKNIKQIFLLFFFILLISSFVLFLSEVLYSNLSSFSFVYYFTNFLNILSFCFMFSSLVVMGMMTFGLYERHNVINKSLAE